MIVGLTGGIASGKSTVAQIFRRAGAAVVDADAIARRVVEPGQPAWQSIKAEFGEQVIKPDGTLNRPLLGKLVFTDEILRRRLEGIIHPKVRDRMIQEVARIIDASPDALVIKDIPLLFETGMTDGLSEIIVVYVPMAIQLERLMLRDAIDSEAARERIMAQMPIEEKRRLGTMVIDNSDDLSHTEAQAMRIYAELANRARNNR
ncbi:MAG: dephospho-CoA kinase [Desulfobacteraceae bacterium]